MTDIHTLNERCVKAEMYLTNLGMMNTPTDAEDQLKARARYRLAWHAFQAAEREYNTAIASLSADELLELSRAKDVKST